MNVKKRFNFLSKLRFLYLVDCGEITLKHAEISVCLFLYQYFIGMGIGFFSCVTKQNLCGHRFIHSGLFV